MMQDFRFALRQLLKTPGFTTVAVLTLALAIGVNSAIVALINGVVLKPVVPVRPAEVVNVFTARQKCGTLSPAFFSRKSEGTSITCFRNMATRSGGGRGAIKRPAEMS